MKLGLYRLHEVIDAGDMASIEARYGQPIHLISVYRAWNDCRIAHDRPWLERLRNACRDILLTWEPWGLPGDPQHPWDQPDFSLERLISGHFDHYITEFARQLNSFHQTIYLRPMHEMNGNWYPWGGCVNRNRAERYVSAWHHLRRLVDRHTTARLQWVWCPYVVSFPDTAENAIPRYFPGSDAVDWIALDGYNWGHGQPDSGWQEFDQLFQRAYDILTALSDHPMMIAETGCSEAGGDKARWIANAFHLLKNSFTRIKIVVWFDTRKECDWRIASSQRSLLAFRKITDGRSG